MAISFRAFEQVRRLDRIARALDDGSTKPARKRMRPVSLLALVPMLIAGAIEPVWLAPIAEAIERGLRERVEVCVSVAPRHGKTLLLTIAIVWILLHDPTATILYVSHGHGFAAKQVRRAMRLAVMAGIALGDTARADYWTTSAGGSVQAAGVRGQLVGEGYRWIFVDDPHKSRQEAESKRIRQRVIDAFLNDIYTRQDPRGTNVVSVHARWTELDLNGTLTRASEEEGAPPPFESINLSAIKPDGTALAPELFPIERLERIRARIGAYAFDSLYRGVCRPRSGALFGDCTLTENVEPGTSGHRYAIGVDLARTARSARADFNAAVVLRRDASGMVDVVEVLRAQGTLTDRVTGRGEEPVVHDGFLKSLHALVARYPGAPVVMYAARDETLIISLMARHDKYPVRIRTTLATSSKWERCQPYAVGYNDGRVRIPRRAVWASAFVSEHVGFSGVDGDGNDDQVDAAAAAWDALAKPTGGGIARTTGTGSEAHRASRYI